jgi:uncharacterized protein (TIGR02231 family)
VVVLLEMHEAGDLTLNLSYLISNASWQPVYDLRVDSHSKKIRIHYHALISQNSSENWDEVLLQVSTAQPQINGRPPEMKPWRIALFNPQEVSQTNMSMISNQANRIVRFSKLETFLEEESDFDEPTFGLQKEALTSQSATVQAQATSVFFEISGKHTLKGDGTESRVSILMEDFSGELRYSSIPKLSPFAYLRAKVVNQSAFPFLAGEANVFLDNQFVATSWMNLVAPNEEFWTYLGIDESIKIEHQFIKKYEKKEGGIFTKKMKIWIYEYLIKVKNFKNTVEEITIFDQLPISEHENLKVQLLEPIYKENTEAFKKTDLSYLEWNFRLKSGEEILIPFKFSVEYPTDFQLLGLD